MQPLGFFVQAAGGLEVGKPELAAGILDALAQHIEGAAAIDFRGYTLEELFAHAGAMVLGELLPWLRLGGEHEVEQVL